MIHFTQMKCFLPKNVFVVLQPLINSYLFENFLEINNCAKNEKLQKEVGMTENIERKKT